jgi:hypothetical protein
VGHYVALVRDKRKTNSYQGGQKDSTVTRFNRTEKETPVEKKLKPEADTPWSMSVPAAGRKYFGLGKFASYQAAAAGDIPFVRIGRLMRALPRQIEKKLAGPTDNTE